MPNFYELSINKLDGTPFNMAEIRGKVTLVVNVASRCGFTPQYEGLEKLYREYKDKGFAVLGIPCNQFGAQEPGSPHDIAQFCSTTYDVSFPILEKVEVNGDNAHPMYRWLKGKKAGLLGTEAIKWNFTKFLIGRDGQVLDRYAPQTTPDALRSDIEKALAAQ